MDACICAYIPKNYEEEPPTDIENIKSEELQQPEISDLALLFEQNLTNDEQQNDETANKVEFVEPTENLEQAKASQALALKARNWQLRRQLDECAESIKCLEQTMHDQWAEHNKTCYAIRQMKDERAKILEKMQENFRAHVSERNNLVQQITAARQRHMNIVQEIRAAETKCKQLKIERNETAECFYKTSVEAYEKQNSHETASEQSSSASSSDSEGGSSQATAYSNLDISLESSSSEMATIIEIDKNISSDNTQESTLESSDETESNSTETEIEKFNATKQKARSDIRLDLSFMEQTGALQHVDSGYSEVTNLASKSSNSTIRLIKASTPNILE